MCSYDGCVWENTCYYVSMFLWSYTHTRALFVVSLNVSFKALSLNTQTILSQKSTVYLENLSGLAVGRVCLAELTLSLNLVPTLHPFSFPSGVPDFSVTSTLHYEREQGRGVSLI